MLNLQAPFPIKPKSLIFANPIYEVYAVGSVPAIYYRSYATSGGFISNISDLDFVFEASAAVIAPRANTGFQINGIDIAQRYIDKTLAGLPSASAPPTNFLSSGVDINQYFQPRGYAPGTATRVTFSSGSGTWINANTFGKTYQFQISGSGGGDNTSITICGVGYFIGSPSYGVNTAQDVAAIIYAEYIGTGTFNGVSITGPTPLPAGYNMGNPNGTAIIPVIADSGVAAPTASSGSSVYSIALTSSFPSPASVKYVHAAVIGAGGAGCGATSGTPGGGGGGGLSLGANFFVNGLNQSYTCGLGPTATTGNGSAGGSSSFSTLTAPGGNGGTTTTGGTGGVGTTGTGGTGTLTNNNSGSPAPTTYTITTYQGVLTFIGRPGPGGGPPGTHCGAGGGAWITGYGGTYVCASGGGSGSFPGGGSSPFSGTKGGNGGVFIYY